jgi:glucuronoarabinoxylan endo-1,4-beta-xylanase
MRKNFDTPSYLSPYRSYLNMKQSIIFIFCLLYVLQVQAQFNVSIKKPVTVDSEISSQPSWKAVDGLNYSNSNRWVSDDNGYPHWIEIDLEQEFRIGSVNFYTGYYGDNHPVYEYKLQSWSGSSWVDIIHISNNVSPSVKQNFDPVITSKIRLYALSGEGNALMLYEIEVFAVYNSAPDISDITDPEPVYSDEGTQLLLLKDISDGDAASIQEITITAESTNTDIVPTPVIQYSQGDSTAELLWTPAGPEGIAVITVNIKDNGGSNYGGNDTRNIQFSLDVRDPEKNYAPTIDQIPDVYAFSTGDTYQINLMGISDGDNNKEQILALSGKVNDNDLVNNLKILYNQGDSCGILTFNTTETNGTASFNVIIKDNGGKVNDGMDSIMINFNVIISDEQQAVQISTNITEQYQVIEGFGGYGLEKVDWSRGPYYSEKFIDDIVNDLGISILRVGISATGFEPVNENNDPFDTDLDVFRQNMRNNEDWKYIDFVRDLLTVDPEIKIIASSWSPPAWMKSNNNVSEGGNLLTKYYQEYAEYIIAYIKLFKEETGGDLYAVSLQNEPTFWEPYNSCQYTPRTYCDLIKVVGERFEMEGLTTKLFYPEEVMVRESDMLGWMTTLNNDIYAREYVDIVAVHGYESSGITAGTIGGQLWEKYYNDYVNFPGYPKQFWMTETSGEENSHAGAMRQVCGMSNAITHGRLNAWVFWTISGEALDPYSLTEVYDLILNGVKLKKYYVSKNYYRYVRPGARAVESSSTDMDVLVNAFWHEENNTLTYVLINKSDEEKIVNFDSYNMATDTRLYRTSATENCEEIIIPPGSESFLLPPMSVSTFFQTGGAYNNHPPTIENIEDTVLLGSPDSLIIILHGISDGDADKNQPLDISASFSNQQVINKMELKEYSGTDSARLCLYFNKDVSGENITTIKLTEDDPNNVNQFMPVTKISFSTWVVNYINNAPHFNELDTACIQLSKGQQVITLTGVTDGNDELEEYLDVEFWAVHDRYFDFDSLVYEQGDSIINIWVTPKRKGAAIVKVSITDNGETIFGENYFEDDFFIKVLDTDVSIDRFQDPEVIIFPNPADQSIIISNVESYRQLSVIDQSGRYMEIRQIVGTIVDLDTKNYPAGIYYIRLSAAYKIAVYKLIVLH